MTANPEESFNKLLEKHTLMVLGVAKSKYKKSTIRLGMRGRDAVRKSTLKVNILQVFTIDFSEIQFIVNHNSQSDGQNKSAKSGMNLHKKTIHLVSFQRNIEDTKDSWCLTLNKAGKNGLMKLRSDFRAAVSMKNRLHKNQGNKLKSVSIQINKDDGIHFQATIVVGSYFLI